MDDRYYRALASAIYCGAMSANGRTITTDDQRLRTSGLYQEWTEMAYGVGDIRNANGQTWAWFTFWRPLHGKSPETARPFVPVMGAHDMYRAGEYMIYTDGQTYRCKSDTNYSPEEYAQAWEVV